MRNLEQGGPLCPWCQPHIELLSDLVSVLKRRRSLSFSEFIVFFFIDDHGNSNSSHVKIFLPKKLLECLPKCSSLPKERHRWNTNEVDTFQFLRVYYLMVGLFRMFYIGVLYTSCKFNRWDKGPGNEKIPNLELAQISLCLGQSAVSGLH